MRKNKTCSLRRPDGKPKVTVEYCNDAGAILPVKVHTILNSTQNDESVTNEQNSNDLKRPVIKLGIPSKYHDMNTVFHLTCLEGLLLVDPMGMHMAGVPSQKRIQQGCVNQSGAYIVRQAGKSVVASGLARSCLVQVSHAIGVPEPLSVFVETYRTGKIPEKDITSLIKNFNFMP